MLKLEGVTSLGAWPAVPKTVVDSASYESSPPTATKVPAVTAQQAQEECAATGARCPDPDRLGTGPWAELWRLPHDQRLAKLNSNDCQGKPCWLQLLTDNRMVDPSEKGGVAVRYHFPEIKEVLQPMYVERAKKETSPRDGAFLIETFNNPFANGDRWGLYAYMKNGSPFDYYVKPKPLRWWQNAWNKIKGAFQWAWEQVKSLAQDALCASKALVDAATAGAAYVGVPPGATSAGINVIRGAVCPSKSSAPARIAYYHKSKRVWIVFKLGAAPGGGGSKVDALIDTANSTYNAYKGSTNQTRQSDQAGQLQGIFDEVSTALINELSDETAGYTYEGTAKDKPADAAVGREVDDPFYAKWQFWAAVGGGAAILGGGSYLLLRKR